MSDLQCPATIILLPAEASSGDEGRRVLSAAHVAGVFDASREAVADGATLRDYVDALADLHRGETVVVVVPLAILAEGLGRVGLPARPVAVAVDSSGWREVALQPPADR